MKTTRVLFVCTHNSARSQMAEAFLNRMGGGRFHAESAGLEPLALTPLVATVMAELGYDLSRQQPDSIFDFFKEGRLYDYVIYVCSKENEEKCPVFPGVRKTLHWPFPDPSRLEGTHEEKLQAARTIRDAIASRIEAWIEGK